MEQIYFLSIVLNGLVGYLFIFEVSKDIDSDKTSVKTSFAGDGFRLVLGILSVIIGVLKLLYPMKTPVLGDLLPALAGIIAGSVLIFGFYRDHSSKADEKGRFDGWGELFLHHKKIVGIALLVIAALHFLFPRALFL